MIGGQTFRGVSAPRNSISSPPSTLHRRGCHPSPLRPRCDPRIDNRGASELAETVARAGGTAQARHASLQQARGHACKPRTIAHD
eukprot:2017006-Pyramimonas_sp.AAC.1